MEKLNNKCEDIYLHKLEEYHSWNFVLNIASSAFDNFGLSLVGVATVLPAFLTLFTRNNLIIGLLPALFVFFWTAPQIISSMHTGHLREKKNIIVFIRIGYALPWLILSFLTLFILKPGFKFSLIVFFLLYGVFALLGGFAIPPWVSFISRLIFSRARGRFFALRIFTGTSFGILAAFIAKGILDRYRYPLNFSLIFLVAFSMLLLGTIFLAISKEPLSPRRFKRRTYSEYSRELVATIYGDKSFRWFITSVIIRSFGATVMAAAFFTAYSIYELNVDISQAGIFMGIMLSSQLMVALFLGHLSDTKGPKIIQILSRVFESMSVASMLLLRDITGVYIAFGFLGLANGTMLMSYDNIIIELAPREKSDIYMGLINSTRAPFLAIAPLLGGYLINKFSYQPVFIIAVFACLLSMLVLAFKVKVPSRI